MIRRPLLFLFPQRSPSLWILWWFWWKFDRSLFAKPNFDGTVLWSNQPKSCTVGSAWIWLVCEFKFRLHQSPAHYSSCPPLRPVRRSRRHFSYALAIFSTQNSYVNVRWGFSLSDTPSFCRRSHLSCGPADSSTHLNSLTWLWQHSRWVLSSLM